jgi:hypothetical protein
LSTLIKSLAEWFLISDDLLSERLAVREVQHTRLALQESHLRALEHRLEAVERKLMEHGRAPLGHDRRAA